MSQKNSTGVARAWFRRNPKCIIVYHWRREHLSAANVESMFEFPRNAYMKGSSIVEFDTSIGLSHLDLRGQHHVVNENNELEIYANPQGQKIVVYRAIA